MIVIDIETSGIDKMKCGIWQIGAVDFYAPKNQFIDECRIDDEDIITDDALKITEKTEEELRDRKKQSQKQLLEKFFSWTGSCKIKNLACQGPQFDYTFLEIKAAKYGLKMPFHYRAFDLHTIAQKVYYDIHGRFLIKDSYSDMGLSKILELCGMKDERRKFKDGKIVREGKPHNALEDAKLASECFSRLLHGKNLFSEYTKFLIPNYLRK